MIAQAYEAAGANVDNQVNLGGTEVNRQALLSGDIDTYAEYNGTGWTVHLGQEEPSFDPEELTANVAEMDLAENEHPVARALAVQQHLRVRREPGLRGRQRRAHAPGHGGLPGGQP